MSVPTPNDAWGSFVKSSTGTKRRYVNGALQTSSVLTMRTHQWARLNKSSNPADAEGHRTCSSYERYCREVKHSPGSVTTKVGSTIIRDEFPGMEWVYFNSCTGPPFSGGPFTPDLNGLNRAVTECLVKLGDQKIQLGAALAESRQTLTMIAVNSLTLLNGLKAIKQGRLPRFSHVPLLRGNKLRRAQERAANNYLEFQFGWAPLCADIYAGYQAFAHGLETREQSFSCSREITDRYEGLGYGPNSSSIVSSYQNTLQSKCKIWAELDNSYLVTASQLGLINPLSVGWEVIPFSFVLDWFLPVGKLLEASTSTTGLTFLRGFKAQRGSAKIRMKLKGDPLAPSALDEILAYRRTKLTTFPWPMPYVKNPLSTTHALEAVALLRQLA